MEQKSQNKSAREVIGKGYTNKSQVPLKKRIYSKF